MAEALSMLRVLKWFGIGLAALAVLLAAGLAALETDWVRDYAARRASEAAGRQITFDDLDFDWRSPLHPRIGVSGVRVADADWAGGGAMAEVAAATVRVDLAALAGGEVVLEEVALDQPRLNLKRDAEGRANWELGGGGEGGGGMPEIGRLDIRGGEVAYTDAVAELDVATRIETVANAAGEDRLKVDGSGTYAGQSVSLDAELGSILALRDPENPFPVDGELMVGDTRTTLSGTVTNPTDLAGMDLSMDIRGETLADLFPIFGFPSPATPPFSVSGRLERKGQTWALSGLDGRVGDSDVAGTVAIDLGRERPLVTGDVTSSNLDLDDLAGFIGAPPGTGEGETASPEQVAQAEAQEAEGRLIPNTPVNLETLNAVDVDMRLRGERIQAPGLPIDAMDAHLVLQGGLLRIDPLGFGVAGGRVGGSLVLDGREATPRVEADIELSSLGLAEFFQGMDMADEMGGTIGGRVKLAGQGHTLRELLATSDGEVGVVMGGGKVSGLVIEAIGIDAAEALGMVLTEDQPVAVRCAVADLGVESGHMTSRALVFDTTDTNVTGKAVVNLVNEHFDVELLAHPKDPSPLAARTGVGAQGTFLDPSVTVDAGGLAARGFAAVALGVLLGPVAALVPLIELGLGEDSACGDLIRQATQPG